MIDCYEYHGPVGREVPFEDIRRIQLGILNALADFCEAHGLRYYLSGGTLLGAVRHKGYIPWDDDIDINMPRPDCDRLFELTGGRLGEHYEIAAFDGPISHPSPFLRAYDVRYLLRQEDMHGNPRSYANVCIDIFPIEGLPASKRKSDIYYSVAKCLINLRLVAYNKRPAAYFGWRKYLRKAATVPARLVGWKNWARLVCRHARKYDYDKSDYVGVATCHIHTFTERLPREAYGEAVYLPFEGRQYRAPQDWNMYLTQIYGDYMKLPPEEKRVRRHHYRVFELEEDAE